MSYFELCRVTFVVVGFGWGLVVCLGDGGGVVFGLLCSFGGSEFLVFSFCLFVSSCGSNGL